MTTTSALYEVVGRRTFRGHKPGTRFEGRLDRNAEIRAVNRGDLRVIRRVIPSLQPGSYSLPHGWVNQQEEVL